MPESSLILLATFLPVLLAPLMVAAGRKLGAATGYAAMGVLLLSTLLLVVGMAGREPGGAEIVEWIWVPSMGVNLTFLVDGLSVFYGLVICGMGCLVCWYSASYLGPEYGSHGRFYASLLIFVTAMLGTVFADSLLLMFVFWELTGVASFLLIGFFHAKEAARVGARRALLVTASTGLCMLVGLIMLGLASGTYSLHEMAVMEDASGGRGEVWRNVCMVLMLMAVFGKSAQFPFQFWLPGAMVAPTPVSTYLHSATMVKLGVFLTARMFPVFSGAELWFPLLAGVCFFTMLFGAWLALRSNDLKAVLAYSTVSQLGMLIGWYGVGSLVGVKLDYLFILTHVFYKASLFMIAGIVDHATGTRDLRRLGGLAGRMPWLAAGAAISTAALAGIPFTAGFLSKESLFVELFAAWPENRTAIGLILAAVIGSAVFSVAVAARVFFHVFMGKRLEGQKFHHPGWKIGLPVGLLCFATLLLGTFPAVFQPFFDSLHVARLHDPEQVKLTLWHGFSRELGTSFLIFLAGGLLYWKAERNEWKRTYIPSFLRFDVAFENSLEGLTTYSKKLTLALRADWPPAYLPIVITFLLVAMGWTVATSEWSASVFESMEWSFHPLRIVLVVLITSAIMGVVFLRRWTAQLVALSTAGFFITLYFVLSRAPDLAMTQILVESASVVMILMLLSRFPSSSQIGVRLETGFGRKHMIKVVLSLGMGLLMALLVLFVEPYRHPDPVGPHYLALSEPLAEGSNAVNTILVDFRGFDTLGEITVLLIATLGSLGLMMRYRMTRSDVVPPGFLLGKEKKR